MKIKSQPASNELVGIDFQCFDCGSLLQTENISEILSCKSVTHYSGKIKYWWIAGTVKCPICQCINEIESKERDLTSPC